MNEVSKPTWIDGPTLRKRWGNGEKPMANSTFHDRRQRGLIPRAEYPFGPDKPFWRLSTIEAHESAAQSTGEVTA